MGITCKMQHLKSDWKNINRIQNKRKFRTHQFEKMAGVNIAILIFLRSFITLAHNHKCFWNFVRDFHNHFSIHVLNVYSSHFFGGKERDRERERKVYSSHFCFIFLIFISLGFLLFLFSLFFFSEIQIYSPSPIGFKIFSITRKEKKNLKNMTSVFDKSLNILLYVGFGAAPNKHYRMEWKESFIFIHCTSIQRCP